MRRVVLLVVLTSIVAVGCGGGSVESTTRAETRPIEQPPTRADYISAGDAICANHRSRREDLESQASDLGPVSSAAKARRIAGLLREESDNRMAEFRELDGLRPPPADMATVASVLSLLRAEANLIEDWANAYDDLDPEAIRRLQLRLGAITATAGNRARAYGFEVCGQ